MLLAPSAWLAFPIGQARQAASDSDPVLGLYRPAPHSEHPLPYVPVGQVSHVPGVKPVPAVHSMVQLSAANEDSVEGEGVSELVGWQVVG
jgi:hypothetical protein